MRLGWNSLSGEAPGCGSFKFGRAWFAAAWQLATLGLREMQASNSYADSIDAARSVGGRRSDGCKATAAVHFSPAFCPIATAMGLQTRQKLSSLGPPFASPPSAAHAPSANPSIPQGERSNC